MEWWNTGQIGEKVQVRCNTVIVVFVITPNSFLIVAKIILCLLSSVIGYKFVQYVLTDHSKHAFYSTNQKSNLNRPILIWVRRAFSHFWHQLPRYWERPKVFSPLQIINNELFSTCTMKSYATPKICSRIGAVFS